ncbi:hypothetical protein EDI_183760 [Entamoeba dispar SAW760]|uniref:Potassium channel tetramerisation-type BTB domain-containing protein n=1 Tax=Entamoeba dispar (strain ATCC PRA-260 / SAW760) TaxID=370354 RepID=B0E6Q5_ENTDS|nr:uncharacterized protein EDI_183760 [Entamoeba dispar SAW760]EDR29787.1 hypothetical protein EDI_183760 [Entamoeba dispar SAW760]|eukprot:EDR29787.1 hypothetical protein EDI_183760 [Entamoeba dispar SAW760]
MNSKEQSELIQRQRQEIAVIREEVDNKLDNLQESLKVNEKTFLEMMVLEGNSKLRIVETIKQSIPQTEDTVIATNQLEELLQGFLQMHKDGSSKIEQILEGVVNDFNRIKTDMLISIDVSLRSMEKRLKKYEEQFKEIERFQKSLGSFSPKEVTIEFIDGEETIDENVIQSGRCQNSFFAKYIAFKQEPKGDDLDEIKEQNEESQNEEKTVTEEIESDKTEKKKIRINRSKELFKYVLMYLTKGEIICNDKSLNEIQAIVNELMEYGINSDDIYDSMKKCVNAFILSHNELTIKEICTSINLQDYEQLFILQKSSLDCGEFEKKIFELILSKQTIKSAQEIINDMIFNGGVHIEKIHKKELIDFIVSSLPKRGSIKFKVSNGNMLVSGSTITNKLHKQFNTAMIPEQVSAYTARVAAPGKSGICNAMYIGFTYATPDTIPVGQQWVKMGYYMSIYNGNLYSEKINPNTPNHQYYNSEITMEDSIVCWYSKEDKAIGFIINGVLLKPAFIGITQTELYPIVVMYEADQSFILDSFIPLK